MMHSLTYLAWRWLSAQVDWWAGTTLASAYICTALLPKIIETIQGVELPRRHTIVASIQGGWEEALDLA